MADTELPQLSSIEARVLGSLIEKKELTPDVYPLTVNAALAAATQKTARDPVMALETSDINRALAGLQQKGLVRQMFASRVERYEHTVAQRFSLTTPQIAVLGLLLLRGPQTAYELLARTERMAKFASIEELRDNLDLLIGRRPPLVLQLERAPGQREERFANLLSGPVEASAPVQPTRPIAAESDMEARLRTLEQQVAALTARLDALAGR